LWSIHPKYLDAAGLVALWRESLLAQKVLKGETQGYKNHPQLKRFRNHSHPQRAIANYLIEVWEESRRRKYNFDKRKLGRRSKTEKIPVTRGQLRYEFELIRNRLKRRDPRGYRDLLSIREIECHPLFRVMEGQVEDWKNKT
jgi:hypothetical protein